MPLSRVYESFDPRVVGLQNTVAVNFAGNPALAIPIPANDRIVTSLQLVGPRLSEAALLNAGRLVGSQRSRLDVTKSRSSRVPLTPTLPNTADGKKSPRSALRRSAVALYLNRRLWPFTALNSWTGSLFTGLKSWLGLHLNRRQLRVLGGRLKGESPPHALTRVPNPLWRRTDIANGTPRNKTSSPKAAR